MSDVLVAGREMDVVLEVVEHRSEVSDRNFASVDGLHALSEYR